MNDLTAYIKLKMPHLRGEVLRIIDSAFQKEEKKKGERLLNQGDVCRNLYFLANGICRSFSFRNGADITTWFGFKDDFITSFTSFFPQAPSYESIEMLTDGTLYKISRQRLIEIQKEAIEIERTINFFSSLYTIQLEKRLFVIQTHSATEKYKLILEDQPHLIQSISNKHLSSYLGITRETLSRIRSGIN